MVLQFRSINNYKIPNATNFIQAIIINLLFFSIVNAIKLKDCYKEIISDGNLAFYEVDYFFDLNNDGISERIKIKDKDDDDISNEFSLIIYQKNNQIGCGWGYNRKRVESEIEIASEKHENYRTIIKPNFNVPNSVSEIDSIIWTGREYVSKMELIRRERVKVALINEAKVKEQELATREGIPFELIIQIPGNNFEKAVGERKTYWDGTREVTQFNIINKKFYDSLDVVLVKYFDEKEFDESEVEKSCIKITKSEGNLYNTVLKFDKVFPGDYILDLIYIKNKSSSSYNSGTIYHIFQKIQVSSDNKSIYIYPEDDKYKNIYPFYTFYNEGMNKLAQKTIGFKDEIVLNGDSYNKSFDVGNYRFCVYFEAPDYNLKKTLSVHANTDEYYLAFLAAEDMPTLKAELTVNGVKKERTIYLFNREGNNEYGEYLWKKYFNHVSLGSYSTDWISDSIKNSPFVLNYNYLLHVKCGVNPRGILGMGGAEVTFKGVEANIDFSIYRKGTGTIKASYSRNRINIELTEQ